jgi:tetratricopeptide (TPR) repeat protein
MSDDRIWLIDALLANADFPANSREELRPALQMAEQALDLSRELGDKRRELSSLMSVARIRLSLRESNSLAIAEEALALARQLGDLPTEVSMLLRIGNAYGMDNLSRSREYLEAALARSESLNDKRIEILLLETLGREFERDGDYYRQLTQYERKRLKLSREIGNRYVEGQTLMFCGQIEGLYLGDYESGLKLEREVLQIWEPITGRLFPLLRIAQILIAQGKYADALATLDTARPLGDKVVMDIGRAGLGMVTIILSNALNDEARLREALELVNQIQQMTTDNMISQQYRMAVACEASNTHLKLAAYCRERDNNEYWMHLTQALESSQNAVDLYQHFGFVQIVECTSEEILYRHALALQANQHPVEAIEFLERAYQEMMRKHDLIPSDSPFRKTFLENIQLHMDIQNLYGEWLAPKPRRRKKSNPSSQ